MPGEMAHQKNSGYNYDVGCDYYDNSCHFALLFLSPLRQYLFSLKCLRA
jgi:hypothetical protein